MISYDVKCLKCGGDTEHLVPDEYQCGEVECISTHDDNDEWFICKNKNCNCYH